MSAFRLPALLSVTSNSSLPLSLSLSLSYEKKLIRRWSWTFILPRSIGAQCFCQGTPAPVGQLLMVILSVLMVLPYSSSQHTVKASVIDLSLRASTFSWMALSVSLMLTFSPFTVALTALSEGRTSLVKVLPLVLYPKSSASIYRTVPSE